MEQTSRTPELSEYKGKSNARGLWRRCPPKHPWPVKLWDTGSVSTQIQIDHGICVLAVDKALHFTDRDTEAGKQPPRSTWLSLGEPRPSILSSFHSPLFSDNSVLPSRPIATSVCRSQICPAAGGEVHVGRASWAEKALLTFPHGVQAVQHEVVDGTADDAVVQ